MSSSSHSIIGFIKALCGRLYLILLLSFAASSCFGQLQDLRLSFNHLGVKDGLSEGTNAWVYRDSYGFVWISSMDGLNRFDGMSVTVYRSDPNDEYSIHDNIITSTFFEDDAGDLWFTSYGAIHKYDRLYDRFVSFKLKDEEGKELSEDYFAFHYDKNGQLWVRTGVASSGRWHLFNTHDFTQEVKGPLRGQRQNVVLDDDENVLAIVSSLLIANPGIRILNIDSSARFLRNDFFGSETKDTYPETVVIDVAIANEEEIWMATTSGLIFLNPVTGEHRNYTTYQSTELGGVNSVALYRDILFFATAEKGLYVLNTKTDEISQKFLPIVNLEFQLRKKEISRVNVDKNGGLWLSFYENMEPDGIDYSVISKNRFPIFQPDESKATQTTSMAIVDGSSIIINADHSVYRFDENMNLTASWDLGAPVKQIFADSKSNVWIATQERRRTKTNIYLLEAGSSRPKMVKEITLNLQHFFELSDGRVIFSTLGDGIHQFNMGSDNIETTRCQEFDDLSSSMVFQIFEDDYKNIYFAVNFDRLVIFSSNENGQTRKTEINNLGDCKDFQILDNGNVLVATANGLMEVDKLTLEQRYLSEDDFRLAKLKYYSITKDKNNALWFKSERGLVKYDSEADEVTEYGIIDGIEQVIGNSHPTVVTNNGSIWMGGKNGINVFHPDNIRKLAPPPTPQIIQISVNEAPWDSEVSHSMIDSLSLKHNQNTLAFHFVPCDYSDPAHLQFEYRLTGRDDEWVDSQGRGFARYFSLPPGHYTFQARSRNSEGVWSESPAEIDIRIHPPIWATTGAYILYVLLFIGLLWYVRKLETDKQLRRLNDEQRKVEQERRINEELRKLDKLKDQFLANTSHELRTPLNGIIGLAESLVDGASGDLPQKAIKHLSMISSSGKRLSNLVNDILDFSKLRSNDLKLDFKLVDLHAAVDVVLTLLSPLRKNDDIKLHNDVRTDLPLVNADENRLQQILYNLVGNAIKFTSNGEIRVSAKREQDFVSVSVMDTGIGIPEEALSTIFRSFEQVDGGETRESGGTGLGLSVTKQLVELHEGEISVVSEPGKGSTFTFTMPLSKGAVRTAEPRAETQIERNMIPLIEDEMASVAPELAVRNPDGIRILVVDDEPINRIVLESHLSLAGYHVTEAKDGTEALNLLENEEYDLILLDIMMPGFSGFEVCRTIRTTRSTIDLPIIMLTAKNRVSDLVQGFTVGANDYLAKPFSKDELLARINTHLNLSTIYSASGKFVPYAFLNAIGHDQITEVQLGDHSEVEVTVLFADIREFTRLSENMTPTENFMFVNTFVGRMGPIIQKHQGFVNQYLGDGIMAIFPENSSDAIMAACDMMHDLEEFNKTLAADGKEPIKVGIGMHTGPLIMGIIGDENRSDPATIADAVNISSRLEGLTKHFLAKIIVSEDSLNAFEGRKEDYFRFLGKVRLKGKKEVIGIYESVQGDPEHLAQFKIQTADIFKSAMDHYRGGEFEEARVLFQKLVDHEPADVVSERFLSKVKSLIEGGIPPDWEAIEVMKEK